MGKENHPEILRTTPSQDLITGVVSSIADVIVTHPLWTIKTLQQQGLSKATIFGKIAKNPTLAYTGLTSNAATMLPLTTTRVFLSSAFEKELYNRELPPSGITQLTSSFIAGCISSLFGSPTELVRTVQLKTKTESALNTKPKFFPTLTQLVQKQGISKMANGSFAVMMRDGSYTAAFFTGAQLLKHQLSPHIDNTSMNTVISYAIASITASVINHPFDTIKTSQHTAMALNQIYSQNNRADFFSICGQIIKNEGYSGFWKGYAPRGLRFLLGLAIKASCIEQMTRYWVNANEQMSVEQPHSISNKL